MNIITIKICSYTIN